MLESLLPIMQGIMASAKAMASFDAFRKKLKGNCRELVSELKENSRLCFRVFEDGVPHKDVIVSMSTTVFDRLNQEGFNFNALKRARIPAFAGIDKTDLSTWPEKETQQLVENIYDKIKELRSKHMFVPDDAFQRRRLINIHKRLLLLIRHAQS